MAITVVMDYARGYLIINKIHDSWHLHVWSFCRPMWSQQYDHVIQLWTIDASQVVISTLLLIIILAVASIGNSYTLVNIQKVNWKSTCFMIFTNLNQLFLWQFSSSQPVNLLEGIAPGFLSNSSPSGWGSSHKRFWAGEKKNVPQTACIIPYR